jgi:hypothetical protein
MNEKIKSLPVSGEEAIAQIIGLAGLIQYLAASLAEEKAFGPYALAYLLAPGVHQCLDPSLLELVEGSVERSAAMDQSVGGCQCRCGTNSKEVV